MIPVPKSKRHGGTEGGREAGSGATRWEGGSPSRPERAPPTAWLSLLYPAEDETRAVGEGGEGGEENLAMGCEGRRERFY